MAGCGHLLWESWAQGIALTASSPCLNKCGGHAESLERELESALTMVAESNHAEVLSWVNAFPDGDVASALKFPGLSLRMLRLAAAYPEAEQLLQNFPLLLALIAD